MTRSRAAVLTAIAAVALAVGSLVAAGETRPDDCSVGTTHHSLFHVAGERLGGAGCGGSRVDKSLPGLTAAKAARFKAVIRWVVNENAIGALPSRVTVFATRGRQANVVAGLTSGLRVPARQRVYLVVVRGHFYCLCDSLALIHAIPLVFDRKTLQPGTVALGPAPVDTSKLGRGLRLHLGRGCPVIGAGPLYGCGAGGTGPFGNRGSPYGGLWWQGNVVKAHTFADISTLQLGPIASRAVLLDLRPEHPNDARGITLRYAVFPVLAPGRGWGRKASPVAGFVIQPHRRVAVTLGASAAKPGTYRVRGFILDYRIGATHYSAPEPLGIQTCTSARACPSLPSH